MVQQDTVQPASVDEIPIPVEMPILPSRDTVVFPYIILPMSVEGEMWVKLIDEAVLGYDS